MPALRFDHFITGVNADNIDAYLEEYRKAGFLPREQTVRHNPGLRNGFVGFGPDYIELVWVEDEALFEQGADTAIFPHIRELRAARRPFGIGLDTNDAAALRDEWTARGYTLPEITHGVPRDALPDTPPVWSFQTVPGEAAGGVHLFALAYHTRKDAVRKVPVAPNSTYAISGVTFATDEPEARAGQWRDLLAPGVEIKQEGGEHEVYTVQIGPHLAFWMKPEEYQEYYGLSYKASPHPFGEIAVIHLLAADLDRAEEIIGSARQVARIPDKRTGEDTLLVPPNDRDGFTFSITQRDRDEWLAWRTRITGERLEAE